MSTLKISEEQSIQYLFFILNNERYAVKSNFVKEIVDFCDIRKVPKSNIAVKGITNIRGDLIPVIDSKIRFGMGEIEITKRTSFIIFEILNKIKQIKIPIALMVDLVDEVEDILETNIMETPKFGTKIEQRYIENVIKYNDEYITVLDINYVLNINELSQID